MELELKFFATFREAVGSKTTTPEYPDADYPDGLTVRDVLEDLEASYDGLAGELIEDDDLRPQINVLKNGREVLHIDGLDTPMDDGDTLAVFPPVAGGEESPGNGVQHREKSFRGISIRLARRYLENLGGEATNDTTVEATGWRADLSSEKASIGPSLQLTEVTVVFEADPEFDLETLIDRFSQKAMRAGG
jgi:MoaD family protein